MRERQIDEGDHGVSSKFAVERIDGSQAKVAIQTMDIERREIQERVTEKSVFAVRAPSRMMTSTKLLVHGRRLEEFVPPGYRLVQTRTRQEWEIC